MGNYILCRQPLAETPYYIDSVHLNIYSLEELCYFLSTNLAVADEVILDKELAPWLEEQCGMSNIYEYNSIAVSESRTGIRLYWIFAKSHYFSDAELKRLKIRIDEFDNMNSVIKQKKKGDTLLKFGKYKRCIDCYEEVFKMDGISKESSFFRAGVYNNMGYAYAKLFQGARASRCFEKAYNTDKSEIFEEAYLKALYLEGGLAKMEDAIERLKPNTERVRKLRLMIADVKAEPLGEDAGEALRKWIHEYHLSVDQ